MKKYQPKHPFTLLEVLVAITILSIVIICVMATFRTGLVAYKIGEERGFFIQQTRGGLRVIADDLQKMIPIKGDNLVFKETELAFMTANKSHQNFSLEKIRYQLSDNQLIRTANGQGADAVNTSFAIMDGIKTFDLEYFLDDQWVKQIKEDEKKVPKAVRFNMEIDYKGTTSAIQTSFNLPYGSHLEPKDDKKQSKSNSPSI